MDGRYLCGNPPPGVEVPQQQRPATRSTASLPPAFRDLFPGFRHFNSLQEAMFDTCSSLVSFAVSAPTGAGKTVLFDLAICAQLRAQGCLDAAGRLARPPAGACKVVYLAPMRALVQERVADWSARFGRLGLRVMEMTGRGGEEEGARDSSARELREADVVCCTPEKFDSVTRRAEGAMAFLSDVALLCIDEVHMLGDGRGPALEAVVCRLKLLQQRPALAGTQLSRLRLAAVSATIPNIGDVGAWLGARPCDARAFGDEYRATALDIRVQSYPSASNDFLFERNLLSAIVPVVAHYLLIDGAPKPVLVFCASRKGAEESAARLAASLPPRAGCIGGPPHPYIRSREAAEVLASAAARAEAPALAACLRAGVAFHSAALSSSDRALVECLFRECSLLVLCTTSTLAQGVNLPARVCIVRGTKMYDKGGYREYTKTAILQMVGRSGRPQFDTRGLGVIMTERRMEASYRALAAGGEPVESHLRDALPEHLCSEICARTISEVPQALAWLKASFLWRRMCSRPAAYGLPASAGGAEAEREATALLLRTLTRLSDAKCVAMDEDGYGLAPLPPGQAMTRYYVRFETLAAAGALPRHLSLPDLLGLLCGAAEFGDCQLRQNEKVLLKGLIPFLPFPLLAGAEEGEAGGKHLKVVTSGRQKLFLLFQDALMPAPSDKVAACHSLRMEVEEVFKVGPRIARCVAALLAYNARLSGTAHALSLARTCELRCWAVAGGCAPRQLPGIGPVLARALTAGGLGSLAALEAAPARRIEGLTGRAAPFGVGVKAALAAHARVRVSLEASEAAAGGGRDFICTITTLDAAEGCAAPQPGASSAATLLCGSRGDDSLWLQQRVSLSCEPGSVQVVRFSQPRPTPGAPPAPRLHVVAGVIFDAVVGRDTTAFWKDETPDAAPPAPTPAAATAAKRPREAATQPPPAAGGAEKRVRNGTVESAQTVIASFAARALPPGGPQRILSVASAATPAAAGRAKAPAAVTPDGGRERGATLAASDEGGSADAPAWELECVGDEVFEGLF